VVVSAKPLQGIQQHKARADHRAQAHRHDGGLVLDVFRKQLACCSYFLPDELQLAAQFGLGGQLVGHVTLHGVGYGPSPVWRDVDADQRIIQRIQMFHERCSGGGNSLQCPSPRTVNRVH